jgi:hypothetical protein
MGAVRVEELAFRNLHASAKFERFGGASGAQTGGTKAQGEEAGDQLSSGRGRVVDRFKSLLLRGGAEVEQPRHLGLRQGGVPELNSSKLVSGDAAVFSLCEHLVAKIAKLCTILRR